MNDPYNDSPYPNGFSGPIGLPSPEQAAEMNPPATPANSQQPGESRASWKDRTFAEHYGMGSNKLAETIEVEAQKRIEVRAKLDQLEKAVLDACYDAAAHEATPHYRRMMEVAQRADNGLAAPGEAGDMFSELETSTGGVGGLADLILKTLELPAKRQQAVEAYYNYRSMAESMGLV